MWGILSHIKYGRHRGTMVKTIVSSRGRGRSLYSVPSRRHDILFFLSPFRSLIITTSSSTRDIYHYSTLLSAFQCAVNKVVLSSRYRRHYHSRPASSSVLNKWIATRDRRVAIFWGGFAFTSHAADYGKCFSSRCRDYSRLYAIYSTV